MRVAFVYNSTVYELEFYFKFLSYNYSSLEKKKIV